MRVKNLKNQKTEDKPLFLVEIFGVPGTPVVELRFTTGQVEPVICFCRGGGIRTHEMSPAPHAGALNR